MADFNRVTIVAPTRSQINYTMAACRHDIIEFGGVDDPPQLEYLDEWAIVGGVLWVKIQDRSSFRWSGWVAIVADGDPEQSNTMAVETLDEAYNYALLGKV